MSQAFFLNVTLFSFDVALRPDGHLYQQGYYPFCERLIEFLLLLDHSRILQQTFLGSGELVLW